MPKILRKTQKVFGSAAGSNQIAKYGSFAAGAPVRYSGVTADPDNIQALSQYDVGLYGAILGNANPTIEDTNALMYLFSYQLAYLMQTGTPEWNSTTTYYTGSIAQNGAGILYKSVVDNNTNNILTDVTKWTPVTASGGGLSTQNVSTNSTISTGFLYMANSSGGALALGLAPGSAGAQLLVFDSNGTSPTNNIVISPAIGESINGAAANVPITINRSRMGFWLVWNGTTWQSFAVGNTSGLDTQLTSASITATLNRTLLVNSTAAVRTITMPTGVTGGQLYVLDDKGTAATNNIIINPPSGTAFRGLATNVPLTISTNGTGYFILWNGSEYTYFAIGGAGGGASTSVSIKTASFTAANYSINQIDHTAGTVIIGTLPSTALAAVVTFVYAKGTVNTSTSYFSAAPSPTGATDSIDGNAIGVAEDYMYTPYQVTYSKAAGSNVWYGEYQMVSAPPNYQGPWTAITITCPQTGFTVLRARAQASMDLNGQWSAKFIFAATFTSATVSSLTLSIAGTVFKNQANYLQPVSQVVLGANPAGQTTYCNPNTGNMVFGCTSTAGVSGICINTTDIELESKPAWA